MPQAYESLAEWFEYLNDDCDYPKWSQYFIEGLNRLGAGKKGLEVGCGSGAFCRALYKAGYAMTGADISLPMLDCARKRAAREGMNIPFVQADAVKLRSPEKFDFLLAPNDCYNYIPPEKLKTAFRRACDCLKKGGVFWLDVSSEYKLREKVANNIFADDRDEVTYLSFNALKENRVEMDVTLFVKEADGKFLRFDEAHTQYIHTEEALVQALDGAGFELIGVEGHLGSRKEKSDRLNVICKKR
ncbi:MAG: class I SAM-dependent methyltransferase [Clostridia bacterium]|jgi:SAM-dependent methyltransferase|nr:class I SAM-dependent methyltransferase [Clostridia bacterium]